MLKDFVKLKGRMVTMMLGVLFLVGALVVGVSRDEGGYVETTAGVGEASRLGVKTKSAERTQEKKEARGDVISNFREKAAAGMSVKEMRWIVQDFLSAGLGEEPLKAAPSEFYSGIMRRQLGWYANTLILGLELSDQQERDLRQNLTVAADRAKEKLDAGTALAKTFEVDGKVYKITGSSELYALVDPEVWLEDEAYRPWNLCVLDAGQKEMLGRLPKTGLQPDRSPLAFLLPLSEEQAEEFAAEVSAEKPRMYAGLKALHPAQFMFHLLKMRGKAQLLKEALDGEVD